MNLNKRPLSVFNFSTFLQTQILMLPVMLLFYQENGLTMGDLFLFQGIFSITALLFEIPAGYIGDIFSRRNVLIFSYALFLARLILWYFFKGYSIVLAGEILYALSKAFYSGVSDGYIYDYLKSKGKTKGMLSGYGKLNFWMSGGMAFASLIGPVLYEQFGFPVLIMIEMVFNSLAIFLLFQLPDIHIVHKEVKGLHKKYHELYQVVKKILSDKRLTPYIFYSGMIASTTTIFVWSFQPLMKMISMPVYLFGVIYFINHICRALAGYCLSDMIRYFSLKRIGKITYILYILSFLFAFLITQIDVLGVSKNISIMIGMGLLCFICVSIGFQVLFTLGEVARLHLFVASSIRSTSSSVNTLISRLMAGILLILFKFIVEKTSMESSFLIYLIIFMFSIIPLRALLKLSVKED